MSDDRLRRIQSIFHGAMERTASEREAYVEQACAGDASLKDDVLSFVAHAAAASADGFMKGPAIGGPDAPPERMLLTAGTRLGPYEIVDAIGAGGMGEVYRAKDSRLGRSVAIKILPSDVRRDRHFLARFEREAKAIAGLNHPNICTLHDIGHHEGIDFLVMEHIEGQTLRNKLRAGPLSIGQVSRLASEVADALATAHRKGLVHRDIKPSNIIVTTNGHAKVVDFGLARLTGMISGDANAKMETTETGVIIGTPNYMSPEQARGLALDEKTDVFSLGVVLFECLTGRLPFDGESRDEYLKALMTARPHQVSEFKSDVPPGLQALVTRCLERDTSARIDASEVMHLSRAFLEGTSSGLRDFPMAVPVPWWRRAWPVVAGVIVTGIAAWLLFGRHQTQPTDAKLRRFTTEDGAETNSRFSPDGQWVSFIAEPDGVARLFVKQIDGTSRQQVKLPAGNLQQCIWSDDGKWFACLMYPEAATPQTWTVMTVPIFGSDSATKTVFLENMRGGELLKWIGDSIFLEADIVDANPALESINVVSGEIHRHDGPWSTSKARSFDVRVGDRKVVWSEPKGSDQDDLWMADLDNGQPVKLTDSNDKSRKKYPIWMGAGRSVIFQSNRGGQVDLWEIDTTTRVMTQRSSDAAMEQPESALADGSVSFRVTTEKNDLVVWPAVGGANTTISDQSLSDFSPSASTDGNMMAFQRTKAAPAEGFTTMDTDVFVAPRTAPMARLRGTPVGSGLAPAISPDGLNVAFVQRDAKSHGNLMLTPTSQASAKVVAPNVPLPTALDAISTTGRPFVWASPHDLFFVQFIDPDTRTEGLMHYTLDPPRTRRVETTARMILDLVATPDGRKIAYLSTEDRRTYQLHVYDLEAGKDTILYHYSVAPTAVRARFTYLHGWKRDGSALILTNTVGAALTDFDVVAVDVHNHSVQTHRIDSVVNGTARLIAGRELFVTRRAVDNVENVFAMDLAAGTLRPLSTNVRLDDTFGSVEPLGPTFVVGVLHRKTVDINILDARGAAKTGRTGR